jgi:MFS transporter, ACS family, hexuronate transporter
MVLLSLAFGFVFFDRNALNFLSPLVADELHLSNTHLGIISAGLSFGCAPRFTSKQPAR